MQKAMRLHKMKRGRRGVRLSRSVGGTIAIALFLLIIGAFMALPIVYSLIQSVKPLDEIFAYPPRFFVKHPTFDNYVQVYQLCQSLWVPLSRYVFNSLFIAGAGTFVYVILASMAAFPLSKHKFPGKALIAALIVWALLFRSEVTGHLPVHHHLRHGDDQYLLGAAAAAAGKHLRRLPDDAVYGIRYPRIGS